jgi:hypothetical protein
MRLNATGHPGITTERHGALGINEEIREYVFRDGVEVGAVAYVRRRRHHGYGSDYGWVMVLPHRFQLTDKHDAIAKLLERSDA